METKQIQAPKAQQTSAAAQNANKANAETKKAQTKNPESVGEVIEKALEESKKQAKELEKRKKELEKALQEIERKQELTDHLTKFHETDEALSNVLEILAKEIGEKALDSGTYKICFVRTGAYGDRDNVAIVSNTDLIEEFVHVLKIKIAQKVNDIETELLK